MKPDKHDPDRPTKSFQRKSKGGDLRLFLWLLLAVGLPLSLMAQANPPNGPTIPTAALTEGGAGATRQESPPPPRGWDEQSEWNMELIGFNDLQGRSTYQPIIINQNGREIAYLGHHAGTALNPLTGNVEPNGTSIIDVTDPRHPKYLFHIPGPAGSIDAAGSQMVRVCSGNVLPHAVRGKWYLLRTHGNAGPDESQEIYDVTNPSSPTLLTVIVDQLSNTHKNWWECDTGIAYLVANKISEGWHQSGSNQHLKIYDLSDPAHPKYIRDFGLLGQQPGATSHAGIVNPPPGVHGPISAGVAKNRVYMPYGVGSNGALQIVDRQKLLTDFTNPTSPSTAEMLAPQVGFISMSPDQGGHSAFPVYGVPIPEFQKGFNKLNRRDILILVSEAAANQCFGEAPHVAFLLDITNESTPWPISTLRVPEFPGDFCNKGGRFGSHAVTESFYPPYYGKLAIISWFNAGVRVFDIRDPFAPQPVAYFIPAPNQNTIANCATINGVTTCKNAIQTNNVELDDRGLIYIVDRAGTGMHILRLTGHAREVVEPHHDRDDDDRDSHRRDDH